MMRPGLTAAGDRVRLPVGDDLLAPLLDALAVAYAENPVEIGHLLAGHAARVLRLDYAEFAESMPEYERSMRAAEACGSREALLAELPEDVSADPLLTADSAITASTRLLKLAAHIRHTPNRSTRP